MKKLQLLLFVAVMVTLAIPVPSSGYSFSAYGAMTGARTLAVVPTFYVPVVPSFKASTDLVLGYGITPNFDVFADVSTLTFAPTFGFTQAWIMPRYDFGNNNIAALQATLAYDAATGVSALLAPQYHFFYENDACALEINAIVSVPLSAPENTVVSAIIAPVWKVVKPSFHLFVEVDPSYTFGGSFALAVVPGVCFCFADNAHQLCVGVPFMNVTSGTLSTGVNVWYTGTFKI
ncbi:MAG: hypothetical protein HZC28_13485 [Spirochaetes bacterium]|nr:hypothetical protein [Spirochaetota bacterium]